MALSLAILAGLLGGALLLGAVELGGRRLGARTQPWWAFLPARAMLFVSGWALGAAGMVAGASSYSDTTELRRATILALVGALPLATGNLAGAGVCLVARRVRSAVLPGLAVAAYALTVFVMTTLGVEFFPE